MRRLCLLTFVALSPVALAQGDGRLTIHPGAADVLAVVGAGGASAPLLRPLQATPGSPGDGTPLAIAGTVPSQCASSKSVAFHPSGRFVYTTSDVTTAGSVCAFEIDAATQALRTVIGSPYPAGRGTRDVAIDPAGRYLYAANLVDGSLSGFSINASTGELTPLNQVSFASADSGTSHVVVDPLGRFVYASNNDGINMTLSGFALEGGGLSPVPYSPLRITTVPGALAIDPRGRYLYVAGTPNAVYAINASTGQTIATGDTFGPAAQGLAIDPSGRYLYASAADGRVYAYRLAGSTVTAAGSAAAGKNPVGVAVSRSGRYVYAAGQGDGTIAAFRIDDATGGIAPIEGSPFAGPDGAVGIASFGALSADATLKKSEPVARPIVVYGSRPPYTRDISQGALPPGLAFDADTGVVTGVPTTSGAYAFTARVLDPFAGFATRNFVVTVKDEIPVVATVVEYYNAGLDHYFVTWIAGEIAALDAGTIKGWARTGKSFTTYAAAQAATSPICRYYIPPALGDSHFFGRGAAECAATGAANPTFVLEDAAFMHMILPSAGACPGGTTPVYRVFSNRADANHRYTTDRDTRDAMVAKGWVAEGDGPDLVVMCAP